MANPLTLRGEITPDGQLRVDLPAGAPRGNVVLTVEPAASFPPAASADTGQVPGLSTVDAEAFRRGFGDLVSRWGIRGEPISHEELRELSRQSSLEPNELSRDLIAAREE